MLMIDLLNYGIAGVIIYVFYKLMSNGLKRLERKIDMLTQTIIDLNNNLRDINNNIKCRSRRRGGN